MTSSTAPTPMSAVRGTVDEVEGSVVSASEIEIDASAETVWRTLTDFDRWPEWNPDVTAITSSPGDVAKGSVFRWRAGPGEIKSRVVDVQAPHRIVWTGRTLGINALHVWRMDALTSRTLVHTEESYRGLVARLFRSPLRRVLDRGLDRGLVHLKREIEGRRDAEEEA